MVKVLIIEDELLAVKRLEKMLSEVDEQAEIVGLTDSIEASVKWLSSQPAPDLILMDIELADGQSFEIFNKVAVTSPVIFITSYDEYAIRAFKVNSIDYLLKPVKKEELKMSFQKLRSMQKLTPKDVVYLEQMEKLIRELTSQKKEHRERFLIKSGQSYFSIESEGIAYFYTESRLTHLVTWQNKDYILDYTLDELEATLDPGVFFRANRQFIVSIKSVKTIHSYFNHKLKVTLQPPPKEELIISRERATEFKNWLDK
jgi:two-component system, LytTR family, response regulator LytT